MFLEQDLQDNFLAKTLSILSLEKQASAIVLWGCKINAFTPTRQSRNQKA
jgi:hypothetical protein